MITQISYNVLIDRFRAFAAGHYLIKQFTHGHPSAIDIEKGLTFPWMHVFPVEVEPRPGSRLYSFIVTFADLPRDKETPTEYEREIISDCIKLAEDLVAEIQNGLVLFGPTVELEGSPSIEVFIQEYSQTLTGVNLALTLSVPWDWSACDIPADWTVGGSGSGGSGSGVGLLLQTNGVNNGSQSLLNLQQGTNVTITDNGNGTVTISASGGGGGGSGTVTSVGLSVPAPANPALSVSGSPVTNSGTLSITANGDASEYIDGTGALQTFPTIPDVSGFVPYTGATQNVDLGTHSLTADNGTNNSEINPSYFGVQNAAGTKYSLLEKEGLTVTDSVAGDVMNVNAGGLTFPDTTSQYTAAVNADWDAVSGLAEILNKPTIPAAQVNADWDAVSGIAEILNKPTLATVATSGDYNDLSNLPTIPNAQVNSDWNAVGGVEEILNKPTIPENLDDLGDVNAPTPANGQVLAFNSTSGEWEAATPSVGSGTVTSVGLTMPSAFNVSGSPVTTAGTLAVTGAGNTGQYVRGDGTLANFPSTGGGGGQIFYFNGNIAQPSIGGNNYFQLGTNANTGLAANFTRATTGILARFITDVGSPNHLIIPSGVWTVDVYLSETGGGSNNAEILAKLYTYNGSTFTLIATSTLEQITNGNVPDLYTFSISVPSTVTAATDRVYIEFDIQNTNGKTVTLYTEGNKIGEVHSTYAIGLSSLNGLTANTQNFATGTSGTDFGINSSGSTHTFNLPTASASNRGALSSANWSTFNGKQDALVSGTNIKTVNSTSLLGSGNVLVGTVTSVGGTGTTAGLSLSGTVTSSGNLTLGGTLSTPVSTINDSTTVGQNLVKLPNPSATRYLRINSDNTISALTLAELKADIGVGGYAVLTSDFVTSGTAYQNITGLSFAVTANKIYKWRATINIVATGTVNGMLSTNGPAGSTIYRFTIGTGGTTNTINNGVANNTGSSVAISTTSRIASADGIYMPTANGTVSMSVIASANALITIKAGSIVEFEEVA